MTIDADIAKLIQDTSDQTDKEIIEIIGELIKYTPEDDIPDSVTKKPLYDYVNNVLYTNGHIKILRDTRGNYLEDDYTSRGGEILCEYIKETCLPQIKSYIPSQGLTRPPRITPTKTSEETKNPAPTVQGSTGGIEFRQGLTREFKDAVKLTVESGPGGQIEDPSLLSTAEVAIKNAISETKDSTLRSVMEHVYSAIQGDEDPRWRGKSLLYQETRKSLASELKNLKPIYDATIKDPSRVDIFMGQIRKISEKIVENMKKHGTLKDMEALIEETDDSDLKEIVRNIHLIISSATIPDYPEYQKLTAFLESKQGAEQQTDLSILRQAYHELLQNQYDRQATQSLIGMIMDDATEFYTRNQPVDNRLSGSSSGAGEVKNIPLAGQDLDADIQALIDQMDNKLHQIFFSIIYELIKDDPNDRKVSDENLNYVNQVLEKFGENDNLTSLRNLYPLVRASSGDNYTGKTFCQMFKAIAQPIAEELSPNVEVVLGSPSRRIPGSEPGAVKTQFTGMGPPAGRVVLSPAEAKKREREYNIGWYKRVQARRLAEETKLKLVTGKEDEPISQPLSVTKTSSPKSQAANANSSTETFGKSSPRQELLTFLNTHKSGSGKGQTQTSGQGNENEPVQLEDTPKSKNSGPSSSSPG